MAGENKSSSMNEYTLELLDAKAQTVSTPLSTREHVFDMNKGGNARIRPLDGFSFIL